MKKKKPDIKWTDIIIPPLPRDTSFILEGILVELRKIREAVEKTGAYPIPNPSFRFPDDRPLSTNYPPWYPPGCVITSGMNAPGTMAAPPGDYCVPSGERLRPKDCYTKKELEDKFGVKK
jgi:hypothetical protein